jgi:hypothetical protein
MSAVSIERHRDKEFPTADLNSNSQKCDTLQTTCFERWKYAGLSISVEIPRKNTQKSIIGLRYSSEPHVHVLQDGNNSFTKMDFCNQDLVTRADNRPL